MQPQTIAIGVARASQTGAMATKSLEESQNDAVRAVTRAIMDRDFEGKQLRAAPVFGVSQGYLGEFLSGRRGAGMKLLRGVANYAGVSIDQLMGNTGTVEGTVEVVRAFANERYPARAQAIALLVESGWSQEEADAAADSAHLAGHQAEGEPVLVWVDRLRAARMLMLAGDTGRAVVPDEV